MASTAFELGPATSMMFPTWPVEEKAGDGTSLTEAFDVDAFLDSVLGAGLSGSRATSSIDHTNAARISTLRVVATMNAPRFVADQWTQQVVTNAWSQPITPNTLISRLCFSNAMSPPITGTLTNISSPPITPISSVRLNSAISSMIITAALTNISSPLITPNTMIPSARLNTALPSPVITSGWIQQMVRSMALPVTVAAAKAEPAASTEDASVEARFSALADQWSRETEMLSVHSKAILHRSYQKIIAMGSRIVPLLLQRLRDKPDHWFWALSILTDEDPAVGASNFAEARQAWLNWGRDHGYLA